MTLLVASVLAGCATTPAAPAEPAPGLDGIRVGEGLLHHGGARGGLALVHLAEGDAATIGLPEGALLLHEGRLVPAREPVTLARGELLQYLPPYGAGRVSFTAEVGDQREEIGIDLGPADPLVDGAFVVELLEIQRELFPRRTPGHESYAASIAWFAEFFAARGLDVETFTSPLPDVTLPVGGVSTQSVQSVLGTKRGMGAGDRLIVIGGHFDVVEETTEGAFDNTGGTMAVLALADAFSRLNTSRTLVFAAWGGEEDGILGSQAWLAAHPELVPRIDLYVNFDVSGLAWPAPVVDPAPIVATTGPDGPLGDALAAQHRAVVADWMRLDAPFVYEGVAQGQATGAGVNAQSDHTPFAARGIPVLFQFTSRVGEAFAFIHSERDTLDNLLGYALRGPEGIGVELNQTEKAEAEAALGASFETQMVAAFYMVVLTDAGEFAPARPASFPVLENGRS